MLRLFGMNVKSPSMEVVDYFDSEGRDHPTQPITPMEVALPAFSM